MRRRTGMAVLMGLTVATAMIGAVPASAASTFTQLNSSTKSVTTSTGAKLHLIVSAFQSSSGGKTNVNVTLSTGTPALTGETHTWLLPVSHTALSVKSSTGKATLKTGSQLSPFGSLSLTFTRTSSKTTTCSGGHTTTWSGKLSGIVHFVTNTGSHGWGSVGSSTHSMSFSTPNHVTMITGCPLGVGGMTMCITTTNWSAPGAGTVYISGASTRTGSKTTTTISASRTKKLSKPSGSMRSDTLVAPAPAPTLSNGTLTIRSKSGTSVTGSATITSSSSSPSSFPCKVNGASHTESTTGYTGSWSTAGLVFHFKVTGNASAPKSGSSYFSVSNYS